MAHIRMTPEGRQRNESNVAKLCSHEIINILYGLHLPADEIHCEVIELLKVVGRMCNGVWFVACIMQRY